MNLRKSAAAVVLVCVGSAAALAQTPTQYVEYSVKFLCGVVEPVATASAPVRPGVYDTSINIHNPQLPNGAGVTFVKKAVLSSPEGADPIPPSAFHQEFLKPDFAEEVDCRVIRSLLGGTTALFIEGFVVLIAVPTPPPVPSPPHELDVVGVYTVTAPVSTSQSISLEMVTVAPRFINVLPTAVPKLNEQLGVAKPK